MIIDCHAHLVPPQLIEQFKTGKSPVPALEIEPHDKTITLAFAKRPPTRPVPQGLMDIEARLEWLKSQGIDRQIVGPWLDMTGYELPVDEGIAWSRMLNLAMLECVLDAPHFIPLATVPMQSGDAAAEMLGEAHDAGFAGAMIGTQPNGKGGVLDDPGLDPFWARADQLKSVIVIHPMYDCGDVRAGDFGLANALGRIADTAFCVARLIYAGHIGRFAGARIVVPIGGAALPFVLGRLQRNYDLHADVLANPEQAFKNLWFDTVVHDASALSLLAQKVGWHKIMMGSDMPFPIGDHKPAAIIDDLDISTPTRTAILGETAAGLFGLAA